MRVVLTNGEEVEISRRFQAVATVRHLFIGADDRFRSILVDQIDRVVGSLGDPLDRSTDADRLVLRVLRTVGAAAVPRSLRRVDRRRLLLGPDILYALLLIRRLPPAPGPQGQETGSDLPDVNGRGERTPLGRNRTIISTCAGPASMRPFRHTPLSSSPRSDPPSPRPRPYRWRRSWSCSDRPSRFGPSAWSSRCRSGSPPRTSPTCLRHTRSAAPSRPACQALTTTTTGFAGAGTTSADAVPFAVASILTPT